MPPVCPKPSTMGDDGKRAESPIPWVSPIELFSCSFVREGERSSKPVRRRSNRRLEGSIPLRFRRYGYSAGGASSEVAALLRRRSATETLTATTRAHVQITN